MPSVITIPAPTSVNMRDHLPLTSNMARTMRNYYPVGKGRLSSAPGSVKRYELVSGYQAGRPIHAFAGFQDGIELFAYGSVLAAYDAKRETILPVRMDIPEGSDFCIAVYGDFAFACNGQTRVLCVSLSLAYSARGSAFTVGDTVVGSDSGATGVILADTNATTGVLTLGSLSGRFIPGESLSELEGAGSATCGDMTLAATELPDAPYAEVLGIVDGKRLACGSTEKGESVICVSRVDGGSGIPFAGASDFTAAATPNSPFSLSFRNGGRVVSFGVAAGLTVVLFDHGKMGFHIGTLDVSGEGLTLDTPVDFQTVDFGATSRARVTPRGVVYANAYGLWLLSSENMAQIASGYGALETRLTELLGHDVLEQFSFADSDVAYDPVRDLVLLAARSRHATINDVVVVVNLKKGFPGVFLWDKPVKRFFEHETQIDFSLSTETGVYRLDYWTATDEVYDVKTELEFEIGDGANLLRTSYVALTGELMPGSKVTLSFEYQDRRGVWRQLPKTITFSPSSTAVLMEGEGGAPIRDAAVRFGHDFAPVRDTYFRSRYVTPDFLRLRVKLTAHDGYRHILNMFSFGVIPRGVPQTNALSS